MKKFLLIIGLMLITFSTAQAGKSPEVEIQNLKLEKCTNQDIENSLKSYGNKLNVIYQADDASFFDMQKPFDAETTTTSSIIRVYCYQYDIVNPNQTYPASGENTFQRQFVSDTDGNLLGWESASGVNGEYEPSEKKTEHRNIRIYLTEMALNNFCFGTDLIYGDIDKDYKIDVAPSSPKICVKIPEYQFPAVPQNLHATKIENNTLDLTWDPVANIDHYEISAGNLSPNKAIDVLFPVSVKDNTAHFEIPSGDFYYFTVVAVKNNVISKESYPPFYFSKDITRFTDVPVDSWYLTYLQKIQAYDVMGGYKDAKGNLTYQFGPANNLTIAECLKMALTGLNNPSNTIDTSTITLPSKLDNHWSNEYLKKAVKLNFSIVQNLENFNPDRPITRGEIIKLFIEARNIQNSIPKYEEYSLSDVATSKYANDIEFAYQKGIVEGYADGTYKPDQLLNRAEITKIYFEFERQTEWWRI